MKKKEEFYEAIHSAIRLGGPSLERPFLAIGVSTWKNDPQFKKFSGLRSSRCLRPDCVCLVVLIEGLDWRARAKEVAVSVDIVNTSYRWPKLMFLQPIRGKASRSRL